MNSDEIKNRLAELAHELKQVRVDAEMIQRLQEAPKRLADINKQMGGLTAKLADVQAKEYKTIMEGRFRNMRVSGSGPSTIPDRLFTISYERPQWNNLTNETSWVARSVPGFRMLEADEMKYLLDFSPASLPVEISTLAPGDPHKAMSIYMTALRRGYLAQ